MPPDDIRLKQSGSHCIFCGQRTDDPYLEGVNGAICLTCGKNLHLKNPVQHHILGDEQTFQSWVYPPYADTWDSDAFPIFIAVGFDDDGTLQSDSSAELDFEDLTETEQEIVHTIAHRSEIDSLESFDQIDYGAIWTDLADYISPFKRCISSPSEKKAAQVIDQIPKPTIFANHSIYTVDRTKFSELFTPPRSETTSQTTLV